MSWIISRALMRDFENSRYSQVQEEEYSEGICSDGKQCAQSRESYTPQLYLPQDKMKAFSRLSRFGIMCKPLTESLGEDLLTWYLADSHAKTYQQREREQASTEIDLDYGLKCAESSEKLDQYTPSSRTRQHCEPEGYLESLETFPKSGMCLHGAVYQLASLGQNMCVTECGSLLPTPTCHNAKEGAYPAEYTRKTPTLATHAGGKINPVWTEWLMGWPSDWTDLKPLEMDRFQSWLQKHLKYLHQE